MNYSLLALFCLSFLVCCHSPSHNDFALHCNYRFLAFLSSIDSRELRARNYRMVAWNPLWNSINQKKEFNPIPVSLCLPTKSIAKAFEFFFFSFVDAGVAANALSIIILIFAILITMYDVFIAFRSLFSMLEKYVVAWAHHHDHIRYIFACLKI